MFRYMQETTELASTLERACDFGSGNMQVRLVPVVGWEWKTKKNPKIQPMDWK